jgi:hypothetical protein
MKVADEVQVSAGEAFTDGTKAASWAAAGFLTLGLISTINIGARRKQE